VQDDTAFDAEFVGNASETIAVVVANVTDFLGVEFGPAIGTRLEHDQVLPCQSFGHTRASQQLAVEPLYAAGMAPGAQSRVTAGVGRIEVRTREQSPSWRARFHGFQHLLGLAGIGRHVYRRTHLLDQVLMRAAKHDQSLCPMLEVGWDVLWNRGSPRGQRQALLSEHAEPTIAKQRRQQEIAVPVILRAVAHRRDRTAAEDRAGASRG
jgi:hypothetical protein